MGYHFFKLIFCGLVAWVVYSTTAGAQGQPIGQMTCETEFSGLKINGQVYASLWQTPNTGTGGQVSHAQIFLFVKTGRGHLIPGTVQLFGDMTDNYQRAINFEVFLTGGNQGTGAYWINGASHRQTYLQLVIQKGGFTIFPEDGGQASYHCR